jgi:hypothetical protein
MVSRAVRPAAAGWLATWLALVLFGSVVVVVVVAGVVAHTHARRGEEGVASAHPVAVVFVASFFVAATAAMEVLECMSRAFVVCYCCCCCCCIDYY